MDGGPQMRKPMEDWAKKLGIMIDTSSAYFSQSNGCAESGVKCAKLLLKKCINLKENYHLALAMFNQSPRSDRFSPSKMFHSRRVRLLLPEIHRQPDLVKASEARDAVLLKGYNETQSQQSLDLLTKGQHVYMQDAKTQKW